MKVRGAFPDHQTMFPCHLLHSCSINGDLWACSEASLQSWSSQDALPDETRHNNMDFPLQPVTRSLLKLLLSVANFAYALVVKALLKNRRRLGRSKDLHFEPIITRSTFAWITKLDGKNTKGWHIRRNRNISTSLSSMLKLYAITSSPDLKLSHWPLATTSLMLWLATCSGIQPTWKGKHVKTHCLFLNGRKMVAIS